MKSFDINSENLKSLANKLTSHLHDKGVRVAYKSVLDSLSNSLTGSPAEALDRSNAGATIALDPGREGLLRLLEERSPRHILRLSPFHVSRYTAGELDPDTSVVQVTPTELGYTYYLTESSMLLAHQMRESRIPQRDQDTIMMLFEMGYRYVQFDYTVSPIDHPLMPIVDPLAVANTGDEAALGTGMFSEAPQDFVLDLLVSMMPKSSGDSAAWQQKAINMMRAAIRVGNHLQLKYEIKLDGNGLKDLISLERLIKIYRHSQMSPDFYPEACISAIRAYLLTGLSWNPQACPEAQRWAQAPFETGQFCEPIHKEVITQHGYLTSLFAQPLARLNGSNQLADFETMSEIPTEVSNNVHNYRALTGKEILAMKDEAHRMGFDLTLEGVDVPKKNQMN